MIKSKKLSKIKNLKHGFFNSNGGFSKNIYKSLNCGPGSKDKPNNVIKNLEIVRKKIKKTATQKAKNENIKSNCGVLEFVATKVPIKIPIATLTPKVFTRSKFTALYLICDKAETIDVGIIIAKEVAMAMCIINSALYPSFPKA